MSLDWMKCSLTTENFNQPLGGWNVSNVTNMGAMFLGATSFDQPMGNWNTHKVTSMGRMFQAASSFNQYIGDWNTSSVKSMAVTFGMLIILIRISVIGILRLSLISGGCSETLLHLIRI